MRRLRPSAPAQPARCPAFRCPADHPCRPRLAGEWTSTSTCRRSSATSSPTASRPTIIEYYQEVLRRPSAPSSRAAGASERRSHPGHRERLGGAQELNLARAPSSCEEGGGGAESMGLIPSLVPVDPACRRPLPPPVVSASMLRLLPLLPVCACRRLPNMHSTHVSCDVKMLS